MRGKLSESQADSTLGIKNERFFRDQLAAKGHSFEETLESFKVLCPFHADSKPSLSVKKMTGEWYCFPCAKGGGWNQIAKALEMERVQYKDLDDKMQASLNRLIGKKKKLAANKPLLREWDPDVSYRRMSGEFLKEFGCINVIDLERSVKRIGIPIHTLDGSLRGYTCRAIEPEDAQPKYIPLKPDSVLAAFSMKDVVFCADRVMGLTTALMVEGAVDALYMRYKGIPAMGLLGVGQWSPVKAGILAGLGLEHLVVMLDPDQAGEDATTRMLHDVSRLMRVSVLNLPHGKKKIDPATLTDKQVEWVRQKVIDAS
jgi:DNA primase